MGKTGRWIRNLLTGKKEKERERDQRGSKERENDQQNSANDHHPPTTPISIPQPTTPKEKRRWSFRRSSATAPPKQDSTPTDHIDDHPPENDHPKNPALAVAADAPAAAVMQITPAGDEAAAATKIQAVFRAYLARKALNALRGLVKLQALVRGHLVRKQATATLRCMQALVSVQARARAQRLHMVEENKYIDHQRHFNHRKSTHDNMFRNSNHDFGIEENIKIVEMDLGDNKPVSKARNSYSNHSQPERFEQRTPSKQDISPRTVEDYSLGTAESSPQCYSAISSKPTNNQERLPFSYPRSEYAESLYSDYPNYMANTQSSRAKVRSHSAPKQRPVENLERQPSRRRPSIEGRNVPRAVRMQRSSSHVAAAAQNYQYPWSVKLDRSAVSLKESECGSSSTVLTNTNYCRSLVGFEVQGARY